MPRTSKSGVAAHRLHKAWAAISLPNELLALASQCW